MSYSDAVARVGQIQDQIASMRSAFVPSTAGATASSSAATATTGATSSAGATSFADSLSSAMGTTGALGTTGAVSTMDVGSITTPLQTQALSAGTITGTATLPSSASTLLTSGQQQFASRLASDTGLDPGVVSSWVLAEESGGAATARQSAGNNDWLNVGYTGSGTYGAADSVWSDPVSAADATAGWLKGQNTIPGYGTASAGIQSILSTAGQAPAAQIQALQSSGWAGSGYPTLPTLYQQVAS